MTQKIFLFTKETTAKLEIKAANATVDVRKIRCLAVKCSLGVLLLLEGVELLLSKVEKEEFVL